MVMLQAPIQPIALEEFLQLLETKPASEYIDGQIIQKPMPKGQHSILQVELGSTVNATLRKTGIATAFTELRCTFGGQSIVPDISVFQNARIPRTQSGEIENPFTIAPDWTIEILSPEQRVARVLKNITHCLKHGTQMGWLIDPEDRSIIVCQPREDLIVMNEAGVILPVPEFGLFRILYAGFAVPNEFSRLSDLLYSPKMFVVNICIRNPIEPEFASAIQLTLDDVFAWLM